MIYRIVGQEFAPGSMRRFWVPVFEMGDGPLRLPMIVAHGAQAGKRLYVQSGLHGDEYDGLEAVLRIADDLDPDRLRGTVVIVPRVNVPGYLAGTRLSPIDGADQNRMFPGDPDGFFSQKLAHFIMEHIVPHVDWAIDVHGGNTECEVVDYGGWNDSATESAEQVARLLGVPHLLYNPHRTGTSFFGTNAAERGVPTVLLEIGGANRWSEAPVMRGVRGIRNVMRRLGMIDGAYEGLPDVVRYIEHTGFIHAEEGGFLRTFVTLGQEVAEGEALGQTVNLLGEEIRTYHAPYAAIINDIRTLPKVLPGDWLYLFGRVTREVAPLG